MTEIEGLEAGMVTFLHNLADNLDRQSMNAHAIGSGHASQTLKFLATAIRDSIQEEEEIK